MILIELKFTVPLTEVDKYLRAHREFLDTHYAYGNFLVSGPKDPRTGGVIVALLDDLEKVKAIMKQDPYYLVGIAEYSYMKFQPTRFHPSIAHLMPKE